MSKPALGRGLGELMSGQKVPSNFPTAPTPASPQPTETAVTETTTSTPPAELIATPGVETLLRGKTEEPKETVAKNPFAQAPQPTKPAISPSLLVGVLVAADVLLIVPTTFFVLTRSHRLGFAEVALCVVTFGFAAALGCLAYVINRNSKQ